MSSWDSMWTLPPFNRLDPTMNNLFFCATSMPEWVQITTRGSPVLDENGQRLFELCTYYTMTCASPTHTFGRSPSTTFPGDTRAQRIGTNWIWSYSGVPLSRTFYTHALTTVWIATQTTLWCVAGSGCNQGGSIAQRNRGLPCWCQPDVTTKHHVTICGGFWERIRCPTAKRLLHREVWEILRDTMHRTTLATFGEKTSKTHDCFDAKSTEMRPVIKAKRKALTEYKRSPSERNLQIPRAARSKVQQTARRCANEYWTQLSQGIQTAAITGNISGMYDGIKKALDPTQSKTAPPNRLVGR